MEYHGTFTISKKENIRYNLHMMLKKLLITCALVFVIIALLIGLTRYASAVNAGMDAPLGYAAANALPYAACGALLLFAVNLLMLYVRVNTLYKKKQLRDFTQEITLTDQGLHAETESGTLDLSYDKLIRVTETNRDFYLFFSANSAYVLPKDQMKQPDTECAAVRALFRAHMPGAKLKLRG